ncbi:MAG: hypothetical protein QNJ19_04540 [Woeseiaceae bacterium]|nr:hypothetical protein [Woeseiaceae bacterium]
MSEDRINDIASDQHVSETYRALSTEQTSPQLDKAILDMAQAGAPKKSLSRLLAIKPLAWAATVVLTVSIVFQLQQQEVTESLIYEDDVAVEEEAVVGAPRKDEDSAGLSDMSTFAPAASARSKLQEVEAMIVEQDSADSVSPEPAAELGAAAELGRMQRAPQPRFCEETETVDASSWYQCILRLEEEGKFDEAASERTRLFSEFPDFQVR